MIRCTHDIPDRIQSRHNADEEDHESQRLSVLDEPTSHEQSNGQQHRDNREPVSSGPPESK